MNGHLILLLLSLFIQGPNDPPVYPPAAGGSVRGVAVDPSSLCKDGYALDQYGKYCMVIQIPPAALVEFGKGEQGNELYKAIPIDRRNHLEGIILRIGTGELPNSPPPPKQADNRSNPPPMISNLDRTVQIDGRSNITNASQNGNNSGLFPPGNSLDSPVMPSTQNSLADKQRLSNNQGASSGLYPNSNARSEPENLGPPQNNIPFGDEAARQPLNIFRNNTSNTNLNPASGSTANPNPINPSSYGSNLTGQGYATAVTGQSYGNNDPAQGYRNNLGNGQNSNTGSNPNYTPNAYPQGATNSNPPQYPPNTAASTNSFGQPNLAQPPSNSFYIQPPLMAQTQNQGVPTQTLQDFRSNQFPTIPSSTLTPTISPATTFAGAANPRAQGATTGTSGTDGTSGTGTGNDPAHAPESVLPFLLLFSIVGNLYLGLWMSHLRKRYRELRSSMRGIPISEIGQHV